MLEGYVIEMINSTTEVGYYAGKLPSPLTTRDFVNQRSWTRRPDKKMWMIVNHSVIRRDKPENPDYVRAWSYQTGFLIRVTDQGTEFTYCTQTDPKGWIPGWVVNSFATIIGPEYLEKMTTVAAQYENFIKMNGGPENYPKEWLNDGIGM
eukprot:TRINITY_DN1482_c0_g2_i1.p1 TRINITY_DN1482_c0_g2~~TRINITY_DN1482_c0_g2_i1.p1  ORF type:complete len:150 (+),score=25.32 TRINITY_DN1482_c0_g2_i1:405-854(+)